MKDRWMNVGHEEEELKPYIEPEPDFNDTKRIGKNFLMIIFVFHFFSSHILPVQFLIPFYMTHF